MITPEGNLEHLDLFLDVEPLSNVKVSTSYLWIIVMLEEIKELKKNQTWNLVPLPRYKRPFVVKCVYKVKFLIDDSIVEHKIRIVAKGFLQKYDLNFI